MTRSILHSYQERIDCDEPRALAPRLRHLRRRPPLLARGYEGMKTREAKIPPLGKARLTESAEQIVALYDAWGKPGDAALWRAKLGLPPAELPADVFAH